MLTFHDFYLLEELPVNDAGHLELTHWSDDRRDVIDPAHAGTGPVRGGERKRGGPKKSYYGINAGQPGGYRKEFGLGQVKHTVHLPPHRLYDFVKDPDGLRKDHSVDDYEHHIHKAGYEGYYVAHPSMGLTAAVFTPQKPVGVEDLRGKKNLPPEKKKAA